MHGVHDVSHDALHFKQLIAQVGHHGGHIHPQHENGDATLDGKRYVKNIQLRRKTTDQRQRPFGKHHDNNHWSGNAHRRVKQKIQHGQKITAFFQRKSGIKRIKTPNLIAEGKRCQQQMQAATDDEIHHEHMQKHHADGGGLRAGQWVKGGCDGCASLVVNKDSHRLHRPKNRGNPHAQQKSQQILLRHQPGNVPMTHISMGGGVIKGNNERHRQRHNHRRAHSATDGGGRKNRNDGEKSHQARRCQKQMRDKNNQTLFHTASTILHSGNGIKGVNGELIEL